MPQLPSGAKAGAPSIEFLRFRSRCSSTPWLLYRAGLLIPRARRSNTAFRVILAHAAEEPRRTSHPFFSTGNRSGPLARRTHYGAQYRGAKSNVSSWRPENFQIRLRLPCFAAPRSTVASVSLPYALVGFISETNPPFSVEDAHSWPARTQPTLGLSACWSWLVGIHQHPTIALYPC